MFSSSGYKRYAAVPGVLGRLGRCGGNCHGATKSYSSPTAVLEAIAVIGAIYAATEGRSSWFAFPTLMGAWFAKSTRLKRGHDE
jgi:hypothetical protein